MELLSFSVSGSRSDVWREDEMAKALVDLPSEINFTANEDHNDDTESIHQNVIIQFSC